MVLMEAMASGSPSSPLPSPASPSWWPTGQRRRVLPAGRADAVAEALRELALDPALGVSWGTAGREKVVAEFAVAVAARPSETSWPAWPSAEWTRSRTGPAPTVSDEAVWTVSAAAHTRRARVRSISPRA